MDIDGLEALLAGIESGAIKTATLDTPEPSVLCHEILNANPYAFLDDAPLEERRARAVQLRRTLPTDAADGAGVLDQAAIKEVAEESWPEVRNADELHDALLTLITLPPVAEWAPLFDELSAAGRASVLVRNSKSFWTPTEKRSLAGDALAILRGWMECIGPSTTAALAETLAFPLEDIEIAMAQLEAEGQVLRGKFTQAE